MFASSKRMKMDCACSSQLQKMKEEQRILREKCIQHRQLIVKLMDQSAVGRIPSVKMTKEEVRELAYQSSKLSEDVDRLIMGEEYEKLAQIKFLP